jgi:hypothetical protein
VPLFDPPDAVRAGAEVDDEVDRRGDGGDHEAGGDVLAGQHAKKNAIAAREAQRRDQQR